MLVRLNCKEIRLPVSRKFTISYMNKNNREESLSNLCKTFIMSLHLFHYVIVPEKRKELVNYMKKLLY